MFLFTDVEGSTRLLHELGAEGYATPSSPPGNAGRTLSTDDAVTLALGDPAPDA